MKYTIENKGTGVVLIRAFVPEHLAASFLAFIEAKSRENPPIVRKSSHEKNEEYFKELKAAALAAFNACQAAGLAANTSISEVNKKLKVLGFFNTSYDSVRSLLTQQGCFRSKSPLE
ncbi:MAG: hypothetical protein PHH28_03390 [Desulfuromonadaceae bacterium]|nr:hypothetical protein [Desulfuromonadaceae bacterium]